MLETDTRAISDVVQELNSAKKNLSMSPWLPFDS